MKKTVLLLFFLLLSNAAAQKRAINCDSLHKELERGPLVCGVPIVNPEPIKPFSRIQKEFLSKTDTTFFKTTVFVKVFIDTSGNVACPEIIKGNGNITDSIALDFVKSLKFKPAYLKRKEKRKILAQVIIPFHPRNYLSRTKKENKKLRPRKPKPERKR